jgi:flagellar assembly protein FliH
MSDPVYSRARPGTRWQRWTPGSFDEPAIPASAAHPPEPQEPALPDPEQLRLEIEALRESARQLGHADGYREGHEQGLKAGNEEGLKHGEQQGFDAGFTAGHTAGMKQAEAELAQLRTVANQATESMARLEADIGQSLMRLALRIAEQVLHTTLRTEPQVITDLVRDILNSDHHNDTLLTLRVHPSDHALINTYLESSPTTGQWRLLADPGLKPGDCVAETPLGSIDATLDTRWERVSAALGYPCTLQRPAP